MNSTTRMARRPRGRHGRRLAMPWPAVVLAGIAVAFFALPLVGLLWRAPWSSAWTYLTDDTALTALLANHPHRAMGTIDVLELIDMPEM